MDIDYVVQVWREGAQYIAHAMPVDVASCGGSPQTARSAVDEAVRLFLKTAEEHGTLGEVLEDAGYRFDGVRWQSPDWIGVEKHSAPMVA
jgi:hypothetical protein